MKAYELRILITEPDKAALLALINEAELNGELQNPFSVQVNEHND